MSKISFTSITALRASTAMPARVSSVENNLKKLNPAWNNDWWFPAVAVGLTNSLDDVSWVTGHDRVQLDSSETINIGGITISGSALETRMGTEFETVSSRADASAKLDRVNAILSELAGQTVTWSTVLVIGAGATAAPELKQALQDEVSPEQTISDAAVDTLSKLTTEDVLAVVLRVSESRGGLLNGVTSEEGAAFLTALNTKAEATATAS